MKYKRGTREMADAQNPNRRSTYLDRATVGLSPEVKSEVLRFGTQNKISPDDKEWLLLAIMGHLLSVPDKTKKVGDATATTIECSLNTAADKIKSILDNVDTVAASAATLAETDIKNNMALFLNSVGKQMVWSELLKRGLIFICSLILCIGVAVYFGYRSGQGEIEALRQTISAIRLTSTENAIYNVSKIKTECEATRASDTKWLAEQNKWLMNISPDERTMFSVLKMINKGDISWLLKTALPNRDFINFALDTSMPNKAK